MYYVAWYKNGILIYAENLATLTVVVKPLPGITVVSSYTLRVSTLTIVNAALGCSGKYTFVVTCRAMGVQFGMIPANLKVTIHVFIYGKCR